MKMMREYPIYESDLCSVWYVDRDEGCKPKHVLSHNKVALYTTMGLHFIIKQNTTIYTY